MLGTIALHQRRRRTPVVEPAPPSCVSVCRRRAGPCRLAPDPVEAIGGVGYPVHGGLRVRRPADCPRSTDGDSHSNARFARPASTAWRSPAVFSPANADQEQIAAAILAAENSRRAHQPVARISPHRSAQSAKRAAAMNACLAHLARHRRLLRNAADAGHRRTILHQPERRHAHARRVRRSIRCSPSRLRPTNSMRSAMAPFRAEKMPWSSTSAAPRRMSACWPTASARRQSPCASAACAHQLPHARRALLWPGRRQLHPANRSRSARAAPATDRARPRFRRQPERDRDRHRRSRRDADVATTAASATWTERLSKQRRRAWGDDRNQRRPHNARAVPVIPWSAAAPSWWATHSPASPHSTVLTMRRLPTPSAPPLPGRGRGSRAFSLMPSRWTRLPSAPCEGALPDSVEVVRRNPAGLPARQRHASGSGRGHDWRWSKGMWQITHDDVEIDRNRRRHPWARAAAATPIWASSTYRHPGTGLYVNVIGLDGSPTMRW